MGDGSEYTGDDLSAGARCKGDTDNSELQAMFGTLCSFMGACGESVRYASVCGGEGENADLFPEGLRDWCAAHTDELSMVSFELEESGEQYILDNDDE